MIPWRFNDDADGIGVIQGLGPMRIRGLWLGRGWLKRSQ